MKYFAYNFKYLRKKHGYTLDAMARKLNLKNRSCVHAYETGLAEPSFNNMIILKKVFNTDIDTMITTRIL